MHFENNILHEEDNEFPTLILLHISVHTDADPIHNSQSLSIHNSSLLPVSGQIERHQVQHSPRVCVGGHHTHYANRQSGSTDRSRTRRIPCRINQKSTAIERCTTGRHDVCLQIMQKYRKHSTPPHTRIACGRTRM